MLFILSQSQKFLVLGFQNSHHSAGRTSRTYEEIIIHLLTVLPLLVLLGLLVRIVL